jgi:hypothetical protein
VGLEINQAKTKYMICGTKKKYFENVFKVKHMTFEQVNSFVYLESLITIDNTSAEINSRITLANRSYFGLVKYVGVSKSSQTSSTDRQRIALRECVRCA